MTLDKVREVVRSYQDDLSNGAGRPTKADDELHLSNFYGREMAGIVQNHIDYMLVEMLKMCDAVDAFRNSMRGDITAEEHLMLIGEMGLAREKLMRWLGFVQGVLWCAGLRTLGELKADNMPTGDAAEVQS